jgi:2-polyprenyl-3-methyl-5-hydroxy-6-metoxy-1,4-benzoquinol methylase
MTNHPGPIVARRGDLTIVDCRSCGYAHLVTLPDAAALDAYYAGQFWQTKGAGWREIYEAQRDWISAKNWDILELLECYTLSRKLLDIGAGYGYFLRDAAERGWDADGIEPSHEAVAYSHREHVGRNVRCYGGGWQDFDGQFHKPLKYDAITSFWLLEHLPQPLDFLRWCRAHLYQGGTLCLAVPQEFTAAQGWANEIAGVRDWFAHETHCNYFTAATLYGLLGRAGFRVVDALATYPMETFINGGRDYTVDGDYGAACHATVRALELAQTSLKRIDVARKRARRAEGRDLILFAKLEG